MVSLAAVVAASAEVAATRSRKSKVAAIAGLLTELTAAEIRPATALLAGELPGGRAGVGWSTLSESDVAPAAEPSLSVLDVAAAIGELRAITGSGSGRRRVAALTELLGSATAAEQTFLIRLLGGELRQGALEGVMVQAVAEAAEVPGESVRELLYPK